MEETIEEVAEKYASKIWDYSDSNEKTLHTNCKKAFIKGAKCQAERSYSEEDFTKSVKDAYIMGRNDLLIGVFNKWFEQFKKK